MRLLISIGAAVIIAVIVLAACNSTEQTRSKVFGAAAPPPQSPAQAPPADNARRITTAELKDEVARNDVFIVDVRGEAAYKQAHIKGAKLIPSNEILAHLDELPKNKLIVTYCS